MIFSALHNDIMLREASTGLVCCRSDPTADEKRRAVRNSSFHELSHSFAASVSWEPLDHSSQRYCHCEASGRRCEKDNGKEYRSKNVGTEEAMCLSTKLRSGNEERELVGRGLILA
ncbi:hypothetical protein C7212DRAFT_305200 [Tuber magnatum]|uniref:Uncharacterized protein n=1 Tax=Tuber magnatum TaxID=42249 RepID=A0A317T0U8_9PEZI|nr:hypothetical protein C7212DRAFT_305200 [Tuber magnatum]